MKINFSSIEKQLELIENIVGQLIDMFVILGDVKTTEFEAIRDDFIIKGKITEICESILDISQVIRKYKRGGGYKNTNGANSFGDTRRAHQ